MNLTTLSCRLLHIVTEFNASELFSVLIFLSAAILGPSHDFSSATLSPKHKHGRNNDDTAVRNAVLLVPAHSRLFAQDIGSNAYWIRYVRASQIPQLHLVACLSYLGHLLHISPSRLCCSYGRVISCSRGSVEFQPRGLPMPYGTIQGGV